MGAASKAAALVVYLCAGGACVALGWFAHAFWGVSAPVPRGMTSRATFVAVDEVASEKFNPPEEFVGHVEPVQEVDILPQIEGYIKEWRPPRARSCRPRRRWSAPSASCGA